MITGCCQRVMGWIKANQRLLSLIHLICFNYTQDMNLPKIYFFIICATCQGQHWSTVVHIGKVFTLLGLNWIFHIIGCLLLLKSTPNWQMTKQGEKLAILSSSTQKCLNKTKEDSRWHSCAMTLALLTFVLFAEKTEPFQLHILVCSATVCSRCHSQAALEEVL